MECQPRVLITAHLHLWYSETENCLDFLDSLTGLCGLVAPREDGCSCGVSQLMMLMDTLPETNSSPLKMDGWNTTFLLGFDLFSGAFAVSFTEGSRS